MNPWSSLPDQPPYMLDCDRDAITRFNAAATTLTRLETALLPEPWVGRLDAPIVLLALNPGVSDGDFSLHAQPSFGERVRACHRQDPTGWPYYYLDPTVSGPGALWSRRVLGPLIREVGASAVARGVVLFEYLSYHSRRFAHHRLALPSQRFTFGRVSAALAGAAAVFVTRGLSLWTAAVPELATHPRLFRTRSAQNVVISRRNCPSGWDAAVAGLRAAT